ncbi:hypothetical protein [Sneathiella sp.]|uniref:hypothetical protein n=1 Tax=Sneathiella sp. TaxID=1964365 RepID=UPI002FE355C7
MIRTGRKKEWSILLFVVSLIAFLPPIITIFDSPRPAFGIPLIYLYLFTVWGAIIALTALGAKRGKVQPREPVTPETASEGEPPPPLQETR